MENLKNQESKIIFCYISNIIGQKLRPELDFHELGAKASDCLAIKISWNWYPRPFKNGPQAVSLEQYKKCGEVENSNDLPCFNCGRLPLHWQSNYQQRTIRSKKESKRPKWKCFKLLVLYLQIYGNEPRQESPPDHEWILSVNALCPLLR